MESGVGLLCERAAKEIRTYLSMRQQFKHLNFIGFSLGGIVCRSLFKHLREFKSYFNLFITLATPHIGISETQSCIIKTGVSLLAKLTSGATMK